MVCSMLFWREKIIGKVSNVEKTLTLTLTPQITNFNINKKTEWNRQYGRRTTRIDDLLRMDRNRWAICQKTPRGMYLLDASLKDMLSHQGIKPDTCK